MGTKNNPGKFDCYDNAEPDEPVFVLLGRDKHAPTLVWLWAVLRELDQESPEQVGEARQCVLDMIQWQLDHGRQGAGLAQAVLAGVFELMRAANTVALKEAKNAPTSVEFVRLMLSQSKVQSETEPEPRP